MSSGLFTPNLELMLNGKTILITGASSGIGLAMAELLIKNGARVLGLCRSIEKLPSEIIPISCDLSEPSEIETAFGKIETLDILVNNAGLAHLSPITTGDPTQWEAMWKINVQGLSLCSQKALKLFPKTGGHILNISSMSGHRVPPSGGFYAATKFAVRAITEALRAELKGVGNATRVSSISPGFVDTPLLDIYFEGREQQLKQTRETMTMLTPDDIAKTALHILSAPKGVEINDVQLRSNDQAI